MGENGFGDQAIGESQILRRGGLILSVYRCDSDAFILSEYSPSPLNIPSRGDEVLDLPVSPLRP